MSQSFGTCHFISIPAAIRYYAQQSGETAEDVTRKIEAGEIYIGPPSVNAGQRLGVIPGEGRYKITIDDTWEKIDEPATITAKGQ